MSESKCWKCGEEFLPGHQILVYNGTEAHAGECPGERYHRIRWWADLRQEWNSRMQTGLDSEKGQVS